MLCSQQWQCNFCENPSYNKEFLRHCWRMDFGHSYFLGSATLQRLKNKSALILDSYFCQVAASLKAEKLILMTDVPGVMRDKDDISTKFTELDIRTVRELVAEGVIAGGMIPKVECCIRCLAQGVKATHIIDGRQPHSLLMELLTDEGVGTMING